MKSVYDKSFKYVPAVQTDIRKTFARIRKEREQLPVQPQKVSQISGRKR